MARNRLDFGQPPPSAGGAGAETPAPAKGPDVGPTPCQGPRRRPDPCSPCAAGREPRDFVACSAEQGFGLRVYEPASAGAGDGACAPDSEDANPQTTPPRPPVRRRTADANATGPRTRTRRLWIADSPSGAGARGAELRMRAFGRAMTTDQ